MNMAFAVGDRVQHVRYGLGTIMYGPMVTGDGIARYVYKIGDGSWERQVPGGELTALLTYTVGDEAMYHGERVRVIGGPVTGYASGNTLYLIEFTSGTRAGKGVSVSESSLSPVDDADTVTHDGITYDLRLCYQDRDGDVWRLGRVDGVVRATMVGGNPQYFHDTLDSIVTSFGPLADVGEV